MNDIQMKRAFNVISQEFKLGNFSLSTVSNLVSLMRLYRKSLRPEEVELLLEIPIDILKNDVELKEPNRWTSKNAGYFAGNITWVDTSYFIELKQKFSSGNFLIDDIIELAKRVKENYEELYSASEFLLRNVEVTIRDDVELQQYSNFLKSGTVFAQYIDKAIDM